jgi:hypothetical protein
VCENVNLHSWAPLFRRVISDIELMGELNLRKKD